MLYYKLYLSTQNACELELSANQKVVDALLPLQGALKQWQLKPPPKIIFFKKTYFTVLSHQYVCLIICINIFHQFLKR